MNALPRTTVLAVLVLMVGCTAATVTPEEAAKAIVDTHPTGDAFITATPDLCAARFIQRDVRCDSTLSVYVLDEPVEARIEQLNAIYQRMNVRFHWVRMRMENRTVAGVRSNETRDPEVYAADHKGTIEHRVQSITEYVCPSGRQAALPVS